MPRPRSNLAPRILDAARKRILVEGVDGASLRQIAADAGTNIGMVYYYYPSKDDLFFAVIESVYEELLVDAAKALAPDVAPEARIERMYERVSQMSAIEFDVIRIIVREALVSSDRLARIADRMLRGHLPWLLDAFKDGQASGRFDPSLPIPLLLGSTMALGIIPQLVLRRIREANLPVGPLLPAAADVPRQLLRVLLYGIAGPTLRKGVDGPSPTKEA